MTLAPNRFAPRRVSPLSDPTATDAALSRLLRALHIAGVQASHVTEWIADEPDVRVHVCHYRWPGTAELLWTAPYAPPPAALEAVRVWQDERTVWRNPATGWTDPDAARFAADLLTLTPSALECRYLLLG